MGRRWRSICLSEQGTRKANADAALCIQRKRGRRSLWGLVLCDGIGTHSSSADIADRVRHFVGQKTMVLMDCMLRRRLSPEAEKHAGERLLPRIPKGVQPPAVGSTLAVAISDGRRTWAFWAGDTRIYVQNLDGELVLLSEDDHNDDAQLTNYVFEHGDGFAAIRLRCRCWRGQVQAMAATTDGLHSSCSHSELQAFIGWQLQNPALVSRTMGACLKAFLGDNLDDNASLAIWWKHGAPRRLQRKASKITKG